MDTGVRALHRIALRWFLQPVMTVRRVFVFAAALVVPAPLDSGCDSATTSPVVTLVFQFPAATLPGGQPPAPTIKDRYEATAACPSGEVALSGGWRLLAARTVLGSYRADFERWTIEYTADAESVRAGTPLLTVWLQCLHGYDGRGTIQEVSTSFTVGTDLVTSSTAPEESANVQCPATTTRVGGGFRVATPAVLVTTSSPISPEIATTANPDTNSWYVVVQHDPLPQATTAMVMAECLTLGDPFSVQIAYGDTGATESSTGENGLANCPANSYGTGGGWYVHAIDAHISEVAIVANSVYPDLGRDAWHYSMTFPKGTVVHDWLPSVAYATCFHAGNSNSP